jgi:hypothetical protein
MRLLYSDRDEGKLGQDIEQAAANGKSAARCLSGIERQPAILASQPAPNKSIRRVLHIFLQ